MDGPEKRKLGTGGSNNETWDESGFSSPFVPVAATATAAALEIIEG